MKMKHMIYIGTLLVVIFAMLSVSTLAKNKDISYYDCPSAKLVYKPQLLTPEKFCLDAKSIPSLIKEGEDCKVVFDREYGQIVKEYKEGKCLPSDF